MEHKEHRRRGWFAWLGLGLGLLALLVSLFALMAAFRANAVLAWRGAAVPPAYASEEREHGQDMPPRSERWGEDEEEREWAGAPPWERGERGESRWHHDWDDDDDWRGAPWERHGWHGHGTYSRPGPTLGSFLIGGSLIALGLWLLSRGRGNGKNDDDGSQDPPPASSENQVV